MPWNPLTYKRVYDPGWEYQILDHVHPGTRGKQGDAAGVDTVFLFSFTQLRIVIVLLH